MLEVDDKIKALYHTDGVHKNFRVHFPNGEMDDLTNKDIVYESLSFKESICSSDAFQFGLCEAGEISFEAVGIDNIVDTMIECFIEIDVSSLRTWNEKSKSWENLYSGRYMDDYEIDRTGDEVDRQVFSIPLGIFKVDSSPRSHSDMTHREVTAYTKTFDSNDDMSGFELWRISQLHKGTTVKKKETETKSEGESSSTDVEGIFKMYLPQYIDTQIYRTNWEDDYDSVDASVSGYSAAWNRIQTSPIIPKNNGFEATNPKSFLIGDGYYIYLSDLRKIQTSGIANTVTGGKVNTAPMYRLVNNGTFLNYDSFKSYIKEKIPNVTLDEDVLYTFYMNHLFSYCVTYAKNIFYNVKGADLQPVVPDDPTMANRGQITIATTIKLVNGKNVTDITPSHPWYNIKCYTLKEDSELKPICLNIKSTLDRGEEAGNYRFSFYNAFTMRDIMSGYLELHALFGNQERDGSYSFVRIKRENPIQHTATNYKDFWWDEYEVEPIGYVLYSFKPENGDQEDVTYEINSENTSVYDMTGNKIIDYFDEDSKSKKFIQNYIDICFKPYLDAIHFVPVELDNVGIPYIEDGDYLEITTNNGTVIDTFILTRSMSGIQSLTDSITATSGSIIAGDEYSDPEEPEEE